MVLGEDMWIPSVSKRKVSRSGQLSYLDLSGRGTVAEPYGILHRDLRSRRYTSIQGPFPLLQYGHQWNN